MSDLDALDALIAEGWIDAVLRPVKSGKEANVYMCRGGVRSGESLVAAKVYRSAQQRGFAADSAYREGDERRMSRRVRVAMGKRSAFGREVRFGRWIEREHEALSLIFQAGAAVPRPIALSSGALVLEWIGDEDGAAPPLRQARLPAERAEAVLESLLDQVRLYLTCDLVHGDLSEYNVLWWQGRAVVIDFPQAVDPRFNRSARALLDRDVHNLCRHFERYGLLRQPERIAARLWSAWMRSELRYATVGPGDWAAGPSVE